ncbi:hypothetical protein N0D16_002689 [Salmonella enterica]|nr:hypothetical protein [Salmonella enterica]
MLKMIQEPLAIFLLTSTHCKREKIIVPTYSRVPKGTMCYRDHLWGLPPPLFFGGAMNKPVLIMLGIGIVFLLVIILIAVLDLSTRKLHK